MLKASTILLCAGILVLATGVFAANRAPVILETLDADNTIVSDGQSAISGTDVVANNKINIKDSQIVLTSRDRKQLIQAIADSLLTKGHDLQTSTNTQPLFHVDRDIYLYQTSNSTVRLGWRYPMSTWKIYRQYIFPGACEVARVVDDYYYC